MSFDLEIVFAGPSLFVLDTNEQNVTRQVGVLMPDCRGKTHGERPVHQDKEPAELHAGYVRFDLADVIQGIPPARTGDDPKYELVHRFSGQALEFDPEIPAEPVDVEKLHLPSFDAIAPRVDLKAGLFGSAPPTSLLMRMILRGGIFHSDPQSTWTFSTALNQGGQPHVVECASDVRWKRTFPGDRLTIRIRDLDHGKVEAEFALGPFSEGHTVRLSVANLCALNPLDWSDLRTRRSTAIDEDFKWLYRLLRTAGSATLHLPAGARLPAPLLLAVSPDETSEEACMGAKITGSTTG